MSYKFKAYRIDKTKWWSFAKAVREFYHERHGLCDFIRNGIDFSKEDVVIKSFDLLDKFRDSQGGDRNVCEFQLWDEDDSYLFRVLEKGHFFENNLDGVSWPIEPIYYLDSSDVPAEMKPNKQVADWANQQIEAGAYFVYEVLTWDELKNLVTETYMQCAIA